jgi:hypothetical protein
MVRNKSLTHPEKERRKIYQPLLTTKKSIENKITIGISW